MFKKLIVAAFFVFVAIVYLHNLTRDVYSGDIGDLVTAAYVFGVPHPPGYPLFTFLGFILSHLPFPLPIVSRVGLISVFSSLVALIIFYKFSKRVTESVFLALLSTSILAFSYLFWLNAEIPEVFALNNLFTAIIIYLAIIFDEEKRVKYLYFLAFFAGLSLSHHQTIIFIFPSVGLLVFRNFRGFLSVKRCSAFLFLFILGFCIYLYVPLAASRNPVINWDNASNIKNFVHLVLRRDYSYTPSLLQNIPLSVHSAIISDYIKTFINNFSFQGIFLGLAGLIYLFFSSKLLFVSLILGFIFAGPFLIFYGANPYTSAIGFGIIERLYVMSFVVFVFFLPYGLRGLNNFLYRFFPQKIYSLIILSYFLIIPIFAFKYNFAKTDLSKTTIGATLARNILLGLPKNAVFFVSGDTSTFNVWYMKYVEKIRQDIELINPPGVGNNIFLDKELNNYYQKNPKIKLSELIDDVLRDIKIKRPMFTNYEIRSMPKGIKLIPKGLVFEIVNDNQQVSKEGYLAEVESNLRKIKVTRRRDLTPAEENFVTPEIPLFYSKAYVNIGDYLDSYFKDPKRAQYYYRLAVQIDETNPQAYSGLGLALFKADNDCRRSLAYINRAISIYPIWKTYYYQLYLLYQRCKVDEEIIRNFKLHYKKTFNQEIDHLVK